MGKFVRRRHKQDKAVSLFLDSGAYSAWTQGVEINIQDYIDFIKQHQDIIDIYANLDVIGLVNTSKVDGKRGSKLTAELTLKNQKIMEEAGLRPLPVFHIGEPFEYLEYYIEGYDYISLGGMVGAPKNTLILWLDECFGKYICDEKGMPKVKVHGFGLTSFSLMLRYPWYSCDSTSWVITSRIGSIYVPRFKNGKWVYDENSWKISVSSRSPNKKEAGQHIDTLPPKQKEIILQYIHEKGYTLGKSRFEYVDQDHELAENERWAEKKPKDKNAKRLIEIIEEVGICNDYRLRDELNVIYFQDLEKTLPEWPWPFKREGVVEGFAL